MVAIYVGMGQTVPRFLWEVGRITLVRAGLMSYSCIKAMMGGHVAAVITVSSEENFSYRVGVQ